MSDPNSSIRIAAVTSADYAEARELVETWTEIEVARLQPVFFHHFGGFVARDDAGTLVGFLIGMRSQRNGDVAYVHLVAVDPRRRHEHVASVLYERFERVARAWDCSWLEAITTPDNEAALEFHRSLGFTREVELDWARGARNTVLLRKRVRPTGT